MMPPPPLEVVSFDAAGTLIRLAEPVGITYGRVARDHGLDIDPDTLGRAFGTVWKRTPSAFSADLPTVDPDERAWWSRLVAEVFAEADGVFPDAPAFDRFFDDLYRRFEEPGTWLPESGASEVVARIAEKYRCVVLSNFDARLRRILADLDLLSPFEALFLSCEERLSKPDPVLFRRVAASLAVPPASILHVGDDPLCDWAGAEAAGFRHYRVGRGQGTLWGLLEELSLA